MSRWFRWHAGSCEDAKFRLVAHQANVTVATVMGVWAALLEDASSDEHRGVAVRGPRYFETILGLAAQDLDSILAEMKAVGLIARNREKIRIIKWKERQFETDLVDPTNAERQQRWRDRHKTDRNPRVTGKVTAPKRPETETETETEAEKKVRAPRDPALDPPSLAFEEYNASAKRTGWAQAQILSKKRRSLLDARLTMCGGIEGWRAAMGKAEASNFLTGKTGRGAGHENWQPDLDWFLKASNFTKLMEGSYDNRTHKPGNGTGAPRTELQSALDQTREFARGGDQPGDSVPEAEHTRRR